MLRLVVMLVPAAPVAADMVRVPGGSFVMGREDGPPDERPAHRLAVAAFEMDRLPTTGPLPPAKALAAGDLASLAGFWRGAYRADQGEFDIPLQVVIEPNGSFEAGENDPVTIRSRGTLSIRERRIACSWGRDTGVLTLHEGEGKRIVTGHVSGPRDGPPGAPSSTFDPTRGQPP